MRNTAPDWLDVSDEEEERIQAGIARDPDNPEITMADLRGMRPAVDVLPPGLFAALTSSAARRDRPANTECVVHLDADVVALLRMTDPRWQERANAVLRAGLLASRHTRHGGKPASSLSGGLRRRIPNRTALRRIERRGLAATSA